MRVAPLLLLASASAVERWFDVRPESDAVIHAWGRTTVRFDAPCKTVKGEMLARIAGKNGWVDPHNAGTYELTSSVGDVVAAASVGVSHRVRGDVMVDPGVVRPAITRPFAGDNLRR